jgi:hypothetical protein
MRRTTSMVFTVVLLAACGGDGDGESKAPVVGPSDCDPVAQTGCGDGQKCSWIRIGEDDGALGCVPDGAKAEDAACGFGTPGNQTGYDDCAAGLTCFGGDTGTCEKVCDATAAGSCGATGACQAYADYFDDTAHGFCVPSCDPVTQVRLSDSAEACGSADPSAPTLGCYASYANSVLPTAFTCAPAGAADLTHREPARTSAGGTPYLNGCAPGYLPLLVESTGSAVVVCIALCTPVESHQGDADGLLGAAPHQCPDRGATGAGEECRFYSWLEPETAPVSTATSTVGFCFDHTKYTWDHDQNATTAPVAAPSCADLPNTDTNGDGVDEHAAWGCAPREAS